MKDIDKAAREYAWIESVARKHIEDNLADWGGDLPTISRGRAMEAISMVVKGYIKILISSQSEVDALEAKVANLESEVLELRDNPNSRQSEIDELIEALEEATSWVNPRAKKPKKDVSVLIQYVDGIELGCYCGYGEWHCPNSYYSPVDKPIGWRPIDTPKAAQLLEKYGKK